MGLQPRSILARVSSVGMLVMASLLVASPAAAEVVANERFTFTITNPNPCAPGDGLITLNIEGHSVTHRLADGTLLVHTNFHGTGSSTNGAEYVVNRQERFTDADGAGAGTFQVRRISKGSGDNVQIEAAYTFPPMTITSTFRCVG